jgi:cysteinyl-tRNA synthetase
MSTSLLGGYFDLHGGGMDLKFPHHENEIAQSCAACETPFVKFWMHNGFVRINDEKMSKSLDNFFTVRDVLATLRDPEVLRLFMLSSHYRGPINYSVTQLTQADETLLGLYRALDGAGTGSGVASETALAQFRAAMDDDFNTPDALAVMQRVARELNSAKAAQDTKTADDAAVTLRTMGGLLGLLQQNPDLYLKRAVGAAGLDDAGLGDAEIEALLSSRRDARAAKDFAESDRIRALLMGAGIVLEDKPGGITVWRRA